MMCSLLLFKLNKELHKYACYLPGQRERNQSHYLIFPHQFVNQSTSQCYKINAQKKNLLLEIRM
jgi:hypothetical protein